MTLMLLGDTLWLLLGGVLGVAGAYAIAFAIDAIAESVRRLRVASIERTARRIRASHE